MIFSKGRSNPSYAQILIFGISWAFSLFWAAAPTHADDAAVSTDATPAVATPSPQPLSAESDKVPLGGESSKALVIHKPRPSPSWGKVIQYHRQEVLPLSDKNREILHEFLFQDDQGIVRTAIFHENASGDGYWEVYVWDQP